MDTELEWEWETGSVATGDWLDTRSLLTYEQAQLYCARLELNGHVDWRLPTHIELLEMARGLEFGTHVPVAQDTDITCWTSTPYHDSLLRYWAVSVFNERSAPLSKSTVNRVVCVRDAQNVAKD